jgi:hypothetical protein
VSDREAVNSVWIFHLGKKRRRGLNERVNPRSSSARCIRGGLAAEPSLGSVV